MDRSTKTLANGVIVYTGRLGNKYKLVNGKKRGISMAELKELNEQKKDPNQLETEADKEENFANVVQLISALLGIGAVIYMMTILFG